MAPLPPDYMSMIFEGGEDFAVYYDGPYYLAMTNIAGSSGVVPACVESPQVIKWNPLNPFAFTSDRNGMTADSVGDFVFDPFGRMIMAVTESDAVVITDPVVFGDPMVIQLTLGGRQNGEGVLPGEFTRPTAVALSPVTGNLFVSDTGNGRIQVFNHDGNFIREFGGDDDTLIPGALAVDAFGSVLVANLAPDEDPLRIYNENGTPVSYGALEGHVYSAAGGDPIHYAYVSVENFTTIASVITDINGYFYMPGMPEGTHKIKISASGYADLSETVEVEAGYITQADFELE
jgi:DNA-binding beta-propeller fold protein YncE